MKKNYLICLFIGLSLHINANVYLTGNITDSQTKSPVSSAVVFIEGTTYKTQTDILGNYRLTIPEIGFFNLSVSHISYQPQNKIVITQNFDKPELSHDFQLVLKTNLLDEAAYVEKITPVSKELKERFWKIFFEEWPKPGYRKQEVKLINEEDIIYNLNSEEKYLSIYSYTPIQVENKHLGYIVSYEPDECILNLRGSTIEWNGKVYFEEMKSKSKRQTQKWERNRLTAYQGSFIQLKHLLNSGLFNESNFDAYRIITDSMMIRQTQGSIPVLKEESFMQSYTNDTIADNSEIGIQKVEGIDLLIESQKFDLSKYITQQENHNIIKVPDPFLLIYTTPKNADKIRSHYLVRAKNSNRRVHILQSNQKENLLYRNGTLSPFDGLYYDSPRFYGIKYLLPQNYVPKKMDNYDILPELN